MAELQRVFKVLSDKFKFDDLNVHQKNAITSIVKKKEDLFVSFPTGYGKSIIDQALQFVFDEHTRNTRHIVVVISRLLTLIEDQIQNLRMVGITAVVLQRMKKCSKWKWVRLLLYMRLQKVF
jgi:superfamily II DNA helicase RecQ